MNICDFYERVHSLAPPSVKYNKNKKQTAFFFKIRMSNTKPRKSAAGKRLINCVKTLQGLMKEKAACSLRQLLARAGQVADI